jgi:hypothetical protein
MFYACVSVSGCGILTNNDNGDGRKGTFQQHYYCCPYIFSHELQITTAKSLTQHITAHGTSHIAIQFTIHIKASFCITRRHFVTPYCIPTCPTLYQILCLHKENWQNHYNVDSMTTAVIDSPVLIPHTGGTQNDDVGTRKTTRRKQNKSWKRIYRQRR